VREEGKVSSVRIVVLMEQACGVKVLVIKRRYPPYANQTALPGGFKKDEESSEKTAKRKMISEVGLSLDSFDLWPLTTRTKSQLDPRGVIVSDNFLCLIKENEISKLILSEGKERAHWIDLKDLDSLAFDHGAVLCEAIGSLWDKFPNLKDIKENVSLPKEFSSKNIHWDKKIVFFGGTFYPWHEGHQACIDLCPNKNIVIIPDSNPWKKEELVIQRQCLWKEYKELALRFKETPYAVFPGYLGVEAGNPTVSWLPKISNKGKELLLGTDSFFSLLRWKEAKKVIKSISTLYVVPRDKGKTDQETLEEDLKMLNPNLKIMHMGDHNFKHLSSTDIRKNSL